MDIVAIFIHYSVTMLNTLRALLPLAIAVPPLAIVVLPVAIVVPPVALLPLASSRG